METPIHAGGPKDVFINRERGVRLDWVDALRGLAIIGVVAVHAANSFPFMGYVLFKIALAGRFGVDLFFAISGFVLYHAYRRLASHSGQPKRIFLFRRWARLAPVYYVGVLTYGWLLPLNTASGTASLRETFLNLLFLNGWVPSRVNSVVPGGWSISAEATYALLFVVMVPWLSNSRRAFWAWVVAWIVASQMQSLVYMGLAAVLGKKGMESGFEFLPWFHMSTFMAGVWCWHAWNARQASGRPLRLWARGLCLLAALALLVVLSTASNLGGVFGDRALLAGGAGALAIYAWSAGPLPRVLVSPLACLGRVSYGIYLIHFGLVDVAQRLVMALMPRTTPGLVLFASTFSLTLAASLPLAWLSWKYLEHPVQVWAGKVSLPGSTPRRDAPSISMP